MTAVAVGGALTTLTLVALMIVSVRGGEGLNPMRGAHDVVTVRVIARQWWWEFQYPGSSPDDLVVTANELHIPVGRPVLLELISRDVIHSFWVPSLHGKRDLIPGHDSTTYIQADQAGVFRGQCAEFCGAQHAKMGFLVVAEVAGRLADLVATSTAAGRARRGADLDGAPRARAVPARHLSHVSRRERHDRRREHGAGSHPRGGPVHRWRRKRGERGAAPDELGGERPVHQTRQSDAPDAAPAR